jgi:hypothetical protein
MDARDESGRRAGAQVTTYVLIPGAGTDPRVYGATIEALQDLGHQGLAPPIPLDNPDARPTAGTCPCFPGRPNSPDA